MFVKSTVFFVANFKKKVHKIITCCRKTVIFIEKREKKFHSLTVKSVNGFTLRSRCTTLFRCRKATPVRICLANRITSFSVKASSLSATHWLKISPPAALSGETRK